MRCADAVFQTQQGMPLQHRLGVENVNRRHARATPVQRADQGIGISHDDQARVFQQYERAVSPNLVSGLGLGLFIVNQILVGHKATISLKSQLGLGSTFLVTLPLKSE